MLSSGRLRVRKHQVYDFLPCLRAAVAEMNQEGELSELAEILLFIGLEFGIVAVDLVGIISKRCKEQNAHDAYLLALGVHKGRWSLNDKFYAALRH